MVFLRKKNAGSLGITGFCGIFDFAVCGGVLCRFAYDRGLFSVIFLHFLQKYRCVPKIGFSADIFLSFSFIFFRSIVVYLKSGSRLTFVWHFLIVFSCCIFLLSYCILLLYLLIVFSCCMFLLSYCIFLLYFLIILLYFLIVFSYCIFLLYFLTVFSYCIVRREGRKEEGRKEGRKEWASL